MQAICDRETKRKVVAPMVKNKAFVKQICKSVSSVYTANVMAALVTYLGGIRSSSNDWYEKIFQIQDKCCYIIDSFLWFDSKTQFV